MCLYLWCSWTSVRLWTHPWIHKANVTHPCFGFALTPWQRSKHNTQNPPKSSASITTQQLTVIHNKNSNPPKINNNLLRKSKLTENQNAEVGFCMAWIVIYDMTVLLCVHVCVCVSVSAGFLPPNCVRQWGQLVVIYLQCCQLLQHSYMKNKHMRTDTNTKTQSNTDLRINIHTELWNLRSCSLIFGITKINAEHFFNLYLNFI